MAAAFPSMSPSTIKTTSWTETLVTYTPAVTIPAKTIAAVEAKEIVHIQTHVTGDASALKITGGMMALMGLGLLL